jgi:hypothetical protein
VGVAAGAGSPQFAWRTPLQAQKCLLVAAEAEHPSLCSFHPPTAGRPDKFASAWQVLREVVLVALRMVWPLSGITQEEFSVMRASFFLANNCAPANALWLGSV